MQKMLNARLYECKCMQNAKKDSGGILEENRGLNAKVWKSMGLTGRGFEDRRGLRLILQRTGIKMRFLKVGMRPGRF